MNGKMLYKKDEGKTIICTACRRYCKITDGTAGFCGVRSNENGNLKLTVYGKPVAVWVDPVEKKPLFHFLPGTKLFSIGTLGCNFACEFCQNADISQAPQEARIRDPKGWKSYYESLLERCYNMPPKKVVENAIQTGCSGIAFTYNEPTIFTEYAIDIMKLAKKKGLKGVYVTNGYETEECWDAIKNYIDAANIDLKAYNQNFYSKLCKVPSFELVKDSIEYARKLGIWIEITTLIIPKWNDDETELLNEAKFLASIDPEMPWHVTAFHPDYKMLDTPATEPEILLKARELGKLAGLKHIYCGNLTGGGAPYENTYCPKCNRVIISRLGFRIVDNSIVSGKCRFCKYPLKGVWG